MKRKKMPISSAEPTLFDQQDCLTVWASLKQEYKTAIIIIRSGAFYFSYNNDALLIEKVTQKSPNAISCSGKGCNIPLEKWDIVFAALIKAGLQVAVCDPYHESEG